MSLKYIFSPLDITQNITHTIKMAKSAWIKHVAAFRAAHKGMDPKKVFGEAAKTFKKQSGGTALGGELSSSSFHSSPKHASMVPTDLNTQVATQYSGGKSKKSRKSRSRKSRSHKRRH